MNAPDTSASKFVPDARPSTAVVFVWIAVYACILGSGVLFLHSRYGTGAVLKIAAFTIVSAIIGWATNVGALKMLFHPRREIGHPAVWPHIPMGLVLKNKAAIAKSVADIAKQDFLTEEVIRKHIPEEKMKAVLRPMVSSLLDQALGDDKDSFAIFLDKFGAMAGGGVTLEKVSRRLSATALELIRSRIGDNGFRENVERVVRRRVHAFCSRHLREYVPVADRRSLAEGVADRLGRAASEGRLASILLGFCRDAIAGVAEERLDGTKRILGEKMSDKAPAWVESVADSIARYLADPAVASPVKAALTDRIQKEAEKFLRASSFGKMAGTLGFLDDAGGRIREAMDENWDAWLGELRRGIALRKRELAAALLPGVLARINDPWLAELSARDRDSLVYGLRDTLVAEMADKAYSGALAAALLPLFDAWCGISLADISPEIENRVVRFACDEIMLVVEAACLPESTLHPRLDSFVTREIGAILTGGELKGPMAMLSRREMDKACVAIAHRIASLAYKNIDNILGRFELDKMVEKVIVDYDDDAIETQVKSTAASEMRAIALVGLVAGGLVGGGAQTFMTIMGW